MQNETFKTPIAERLNIGEITTWRLHWLMCDLWTIQKEIAAAAFVSRVSELYAGPFAGLLARVKGVENAYLRLRWETKTMLSMDYDHHIQPFFASLENDAKYREALGTTKKLLQDVVDKALASEGKHLNASVVDAGHPLS